MFPRQDIKLATKTQPNSDPCTADGLWMRSPAPPALLMTQAKSAIPQIGETMALSVKKCRRE